MAGRSPRVEMPRNDMDRFFEARDMAHREHEQRSDVGPVHGAFLEWGRYRWLLVPLGALAFVAFVLGVQILVALQQGPHA